VANRSCFWAFDRTPLTGTPTVYSAMASVDVPPGASSAILKPSDPVSEDAVSVQGPNFDIPLDLQQFISSYERIGFQANSLGKAIQIVNKMVCALRRMNVVFMACVVQ